MEDNKKKQYTWEANEEATIWNNGRFDSIEECIEEAKRTGRYKAGDIIYIAECEDVVIGGVDLSGVLECVEDNMYEQVGEVSEGWDVSVIGKERREAYEKYEEKLRKLVEEYIAEIGETPGFYRVTNIRPVEIVQQQVSKRNRVPFFGFWGKYLQNLKQPNCAYFI